MKKATFTLLCVVALSSLTFAQRRPDTPRDGAKIEALKEQLNLTDDQVTELKALRAEMKPELKALRDDKTLSKPDKMRAHADLLEKRETKLAAILTADQLEQWKQIKQEKKAERRKKTKERNG